MFLFKKKLFSNVQTSLQWKMVSLNTFVISIVILTSGFILKEYACYLVNENNITGERLRSILNIFLIQLSFFTILFTSIIQVLFIKKFLHPLQELTKKSRVLSEGKRPEPIQIKTKDEIGFLSKTFNEMVVNIKDSEVKRDRMLSDIAHELRTPLTNLNGYLEALESGILKGEKQLYSSLYSESQRITRLVNQLNELSSWLSPIRNITQVNIKQLIEESVKVFDWTIKQKSLEIVVDTQSANINGNVDGLNQVLTNLLTNAINHNDGDWIKITGYRTKKSFYQVEISNIGPPIPIEEQHQLFERFYRADPSRNHQTGGTGLGLAIANEIIQAHGGEIGLNIHEQVYTFNFLLPLTK